MLTRDEEARLKSLIREQNGEEPIPDNLPEEQILPRSDIYGVYYSREYARLSHQLSCEKQEREEQERLRLAKIEEKRLKDEQDALIKQQRKEEKARLKNMSAEQRKSLREADKKAKREKNVIKKAQDKQERIVEKHDRGIDRGDRVARGIGTFVLVVVIIVALVFTSNLTAFLIVNNYGFGEREIAYDNQLVPTMEDGYITFTCDRDFKVLQLTDLHIGGGILSMGKDKTVIDTIYNMISAEKPDLVVLSGDLSFAVPYLAGTFNNMSAHRTIRDLFESMGVYYALVLGNHDSEAYNYYNRQHVGERYEDSPYCLFTIGPEEVEGVGNYIINIKNTNGTIKQSLVFMDSHMYTEDNPLGLKFSYASLSDTQIDWYLENMETIYALNNNVKVNASVFMHIPPTEFEDAVAAIYDPDTDINKDPQMLAYNNAGMNENVSHPVTDDQFFEKATTHDKSNLVAIFCGHDHINNFVLPHPGTGTLMVYGMSVDYFAYAGPYGFCRGCTVISVRSDGTLGIVLESYYQSKYVDQSVIDDAPTLTRPEFKPTLPEE